MIYSILSLMKHKILLNKKFYVHTLIRLPLSLIFPLYFFFVYSDIPDGNRNTLLLSAFLWSLVSLSLVEVYIFTKSEVDKKTLFYLQLSGIRVSTYYSILISILTAFLYFIHTIALFTYSVFFYI